MSGGDTLYLKERDPFSLAREKMVNRLTSAGIYSGRVLSALREVPRHVFVSEALWFRAYEDRPLPIGYGQTITKPSTIGRMVQALNLSGSESVLEIGTGSGYQAAVLSRLSRAVSSLERIEELHKRAVDILRLRLNYHNITLLHSEDFTRLKGPYDAIIVAACAEEMIQDLWDLMSPEGTLILPVQHRGSQMIKKYWKRSGVLQEEDLGEASFVPLILSRAE